MAGFRLPCLKSLAVNLGGISTRVSAGPQHVKQFKQLQNAVHRKHMSSTASSVNLSSDRINDNVVYSRHEDCYLHTQTVVQRFFDQASLWPNHTAVVGHQYSFTFLFLENSYTLCVYKHEHVGRTGQGHNLRLRGKHGSAPSQG